VLAVAKKSLRKRITAEAGLLFGLLFVGIVLVPIAIFYVGGAVFGEYGGNGYGDFFGTLSGKIRDGDRVSWFLVSSPYLAIISVRLMIWGWRKTAQPNN
jgi:hypothetical protein